MLLTDSDLEAIAQIYSRQIEFGSDDRTALNLATIVYQQRHPRECVDDSRRMLGNALARKALR
jgi:hypothetical protein